MEGKKYKIRKIIGEGASGTVYKALDTINNQEVAIKAYSRQTTGKNHEYRILKELDCEHIVKLYDLGQTSRIVVMELCEYNLISFINEFELDLKCVRKIMRMLLLALNHIHGKGIIHRDVKLGNILIKNNIAKLCDFGLACYKNENDYSYCGTRDYLAPEMEAIKQMGNGGKNRRLLTYDDKVDVYASGIVFRALITNNKEVGLNGNQIGGLEGELLEHLLDGKPEKRISAAGALKHTVFDEIFPSVPDFRVLQNFSKGLKYGKIVKNDDFIEVQYKTNGNASLKIELADVIDQDSFKIASDFENNKNYGSNSSIARNAGKALESCDRLSVHKNLGDRDRTTCKCFGSLNYRILLNGKMVEREFLAETEIKYFTYLCNYVTVILERVIKTKVEDLGCVFTITGNNTKMLRCKEYELVKPKDGRMKILKPNFPISEFVPEDARRLFKYFDDISKQVPHKCYTAANMPESYSNVSTISGFGGPLVKRYEFIEGYGWCVKNRHNLIFLLNSGVRFTLDLSDSTIITSDNKRVELKKDMDEFFKGHLTIIRSFLAKLLS